VKYAAVNTKDTKGLAALLVRPDGFVAWAADSEPNLIALEETMQHWFGSHSKRIITAPE
jgi:hypothetical protein